MSTTPAAAAVKETKAQKTERLKLAKNPWEAWEEVREFARQGWDTIPSEWALYFRWWGVYSQGDGKGVTGGSGNMLGGIIGSGPSAPPPPPKPTTPQRIRVGGNVEAASLVQKVAPVYPPIAKTAHVSGTVVLHAIIAKNGAIQQLQFVSGPPLLMQSAMAAVKRWRYRPTMLNGQPVEVDTTIDVVFSLG